MASFVPSKFTENKVWYEFDERRNVFVRVEQDEYGHKTVFSLLSPVEEEKARVYLRTHGNHESWRRIQEDESAAVDSALMEVARAREPWHFPVLLGDL